ncbi:MAG: hypothetical protein LUD00_05520 [Prevotellaceae bacterium]|nr:hypothetical protein [Prevotellaceae bacterium]
MNDFDFENYKPVGYVDFSINGNAKIDIVGYVNYNNVFHNLTSKERKEMFPPKGRVFAHNFIQKYYNQNKHLVCLSVIPNEKEGDNLDAYIWDKSGSVYEFGNRIYPIKATLNDDGENNFTIFQENDLIETEDDKYILSGDKVFFIKTNSKERLIPYWEILNIDVIETSSETKYLVASQLPEKDGVIDITNDDQLINWFMTKILKKHWAEIVTADSYKSVEQNLIETLTSLKGLTPNVYKSRLERLKKINANFSMTLEELNELSAFPWVKNVITQTVEEYKQNLINDVSDEYKQELDKTKEEYEKILGMEKDKYETAVKQQKEHYNQTLKSIADEEAKISSVLDEKKFEIKILDETIASKKDEIVKIDKLVDSANKRKDSLMSDFAIIKDVLGFGSQTDMKQVQSDITGTRFALNIQTVNMVDSECMMFEAFGKSLEDILKLNNLPHQNASTIAKTLAVYKMLLVPDFAYALSIIHATQKCYYAVEYVNVGWKSFEDLWTEGLCNMIDHCKKNPNIMHYLVLQNINLTYLPNFMQPLLDVQMGLTNCLPSGEEYPENLRILCTITNEEVIPLSEQCVKYIGCIEKPLKEIFVGRFKAQYDERYGYLSPNRLAERTSATPSNFYNDYINE